MEEKIQEELLKKISDITDRKEAAEVYRQVFTRLAEYQEQQIKSIYERVEKELVKVSKDCAVVTILCKNEDEYRFLDGFVPLLSTGMLKACWGKGAIKRIYIRADGAFLDKALKRNNVYQARIQTNYETYRIRVVLKQALEGLKQVRAINKLLASNDMDLPKVNDICIRKFYDICFLEVNDRLRQDETIKSIQVDWGQLEPYIQEDVSLLWNIKKVKLKENAFPKAVPLVNEIKYDHEIFLPHKESTYLIDVPEGEPCRIIDRDGSIVIRSFHKEYQNWDAYEIKTVQKKYLKNEKCRIMTNGIKRDIFTGLKNTRALHTKCELYRMAMSYEMASAFQKIEVQDKGRLLFYPESPQDYLSPDIVEFIIKDMSAVYGNYRLAGSLVEDEE